MKNQMRTRLFTVPYYFLRSFRCSASYCQWPPSCFSHVPRGRASGIIALVAGRGREKNHQTAPRPLSSFDTHARWQPVMQSALSRQSYRKYRTVNSLNRASDISRGRGPAKFRYFREIPRNSQKNAKYREIRRKYFQIHIGKTYLILILAIRLVLFTPNVQI